MRPAGRVGVAALALLVATTVSQLAWQQPISNAASAESSPTMNASRGQPTQSQRARTLRVATYNICKPDCGTGRLSWASRRSRVVRNVAAANADVVAIQEAEFGYHGATVRHWEDVARLLSARGYEIANTVLPPCETFCTRETHVFYRRSRLELASSPPGTQQAGLQSLRAITPKTSWGSISNRSFSWAFLREKTSGAQFLAISVHLPPDQTGTGERIRVSSARAIAKWTDNALASRGQPGLPVLVMGDLNSFATRQPKGAQRVLRRHGFADSFSARKKVNPNYSTVNISSADIRFNGWPPKPHAYPRQGARVDYILARNTSRLLRYETFLKLRKNGRFVERFRGSDHNLIKAKIRLPG